MADPVAPTFYAQLAALESAGAPFVLVVLAEAFGSTPQDTGAKMLVTPAGLLTGTVGGGRVEAKAITTAQAMLADYGAGPRSPAVRELDPEGRRWHDLRRRGKIVFRTASCRRHFVADRDLRRRPYHSGTPAGIDSAALHDRGLRLTAGVASQDFAGPGTFEVSASRICPASSTHSLPKLFSFA